MQEPQFKLRRKGRGSTQNVLIPTETMLADALRRAPPGRVSDLAGIRRGLAEKHGADACCPVTVQQLLVRFSRDGGAPYWRVVDPDRPFARRMSGGPDRIREALAAER